MDIKNNRGNYFGISCSCDFCSPTYISLQVSINYFNISEFADVQSIAYYIIGTFAINTLSNIDSQNYTEASIGIVNNACFKQELTVKTYSQTKNEWACSPLSNSCSVSSYTDNSLTFGAKNFGVYEFYHTCPLGYGLDNSTFECKPCIEKCDKCEEFNICDQCSSNYILSENFTCVCESQHFDNGAECLSCGTYCKQCANETHCEVCLSNYTNLNNGSCGCELGFYDNGEGCSECGHHCEDCLSVYECLTCKSNYINFDDGTCGCSNGTFDNNTGCEACGSKCEICSDLENCITCEAYYTNFQNGTCGCPAHYFDSGTLCGPCGVKCDTCLNETVCEVCMSNYTNFDNGTCGCNTGFGDDGFGCVECSSNCDNCTSESECVQCATGYALKDGKCVAGHQYIQQSYIQSALFDTTFSVIQIKLSKQLPAFTDNDCKNYLVDISKLGSDPLCSLYSNYILNILLGTS